MNRVTRYGWSLVAVVMLGTGSVPAAEPGVASGGRIRPEIYVTGITNYYRDEGRSENFDSIALTAELNWYPALRRYRSGLFVDYRNSSSERLNDNLNVGAYLRFDIRRWDATSWLFVNRSPQTASTLVYAGRLRYRLLESHKIGIEALAPVERANEPTLMLGYYGTVSSALSLKLLFGSAVGNRSDTTARLEIMWQVH
jgi:hypothetical protein